MLRVMATREGILQCLILSANKTFQAGTGLCRPDPAGDGTTEDYFTVEFAAGRVASITRVSPNTLEPASAEPPDQDAECPAGFFKNPDDYCLPQDRPCGYLILDIAEAKVYQSSCDTDDPLTDPDTGGEFPPIYVEGFSFSGNCSSLQVGTPSCSSGQSDGQPGDSGSICDGLDFNTCQSTPGCTPSAGGCVPD